VSERIPHPTEPAHAPDEPGARIVCAICHEVDTVDELAGESGPTQEFPLVRCRVCGLVFQKFTRTETELDEAQEHAYGEPERRFGSLTETGIRLFRRARVQMARRLLPPRGRVLDVGCGRGVFLRMLAERGHDVRGTELSTATAANACPEVPVDVGDLTPGRYQSGSFDLISIWHVLEHARQPDVVLRGAHEALTPDGALVLAVPNFASVQAKVGGARWFHLDLPRHIFQFTPATLGRLLEETGFRVERMKTGQWEMDPFGLLQTLLNRTGLRHNALYDSLRNNEVVRQDLPGWVRLALIAAFPIGMVLAIPASLLFRIMGRAGTVIVIARPT